ncbi:MAG: hypothetical protein P1S46_04965 [bacterium]|nr:hypothetical protein [bacterium]
MQAPKDNHTFFIPVMGIGFTIDTPVKLARYGISSVISLVDDTFIEQMRKYYCEKTGEPYEEIGRNEKDWRADRITAYLNMVDCIVARQVEALKASPFEADSEITRYFQLLPESPLKDKYRKMLESTDPGEKRQLQDILRASANPGSIDVNIMTKVDRMYYEKGAALPPEFSDARAALRGYANSDLESSIVFSAGLNPSLYSYIANFPDFFPEKSGRIKKKIVLKVSDYRSAVVQARFLAKKGLWVSEYRIESGLNCGGHAFAAKGHLMGPILEEFRSKREELAAQTFAVLKKALGDAPLPDSTRMRITVSGGIGTSEEHEFLKKYYDVDGAGWGTPFLLVPEATNVDDEHLEKLCNAGDEDVFLSAASPLTVPFWNLRNSSSEEHRRILIEAGTPGSACPKGHAKIFNTEFTAKPNCIAARSYVKKKLAKIDSGDYTDEQRRWYREDVLAKSCICHDLSGGATRKLGIDPDALTAVCCGPGIVNYSKIATLEEMVGHIYGRLSLLTRSDRPHMFIKEMMLYIEYLSEEIRRLSLGVAENAPSYFAEFKENLLSGIDYYRGLAEQFVEDTKNRFLDDLQAQRDAIERIFETLSAEMGGEKAIS